MNEREFIRIGRAVLERAEEAERELTAASERIKVLNTENDLLLRRIGELVGFNGKNVVALTAEREVSDKLEKALREAENDLRVCDYTTASAMAQHALVEAAAIRKQQKEKKCEPN